ncbi:hypothetical protein DIPPA_18866 [Diplonema papillatum]|nr:hypothetical protein DIPPA_18866 [Diplonema papillatum]
MGHTLLSCWLLVTAWAAHAAAEKKSACQTSFEKVNKLRSETKQEPNEDPADFATRRGKAMKKAIKILQKCVDSGDEEHLAQALSNIASTHADAKDFDKARETLAKLPEDMKTEEYRYRLATLTARENKLEEAIEEWGALLHGMLVSDADGESWAETRRRISELPFDTPEGSVMRSNRIRETRETLAKLPEDMKTEEYRYRLATLTARENKLEEAIEEWGALLHGMLVSDADGESWAETRRRISELPFDTPEGSVMRSNRIRETRETLAKLPEDMKTEEYRYRLATLTARENKLEEAIEEWGALLHGMLVSDADGESWAETRRRISELPFDTPEGSVMRSNRIRETVLQDMMRAYAALDDGPGYIETVLVAQVVEPMNSGIRKFTSTYMAAILDVGSVWRGYMPQPGVRISSAADVFDSILAFCAQLPEAVHVATEHVFLKRLQDGAVARMNAECGTSLSGEADAIKYRDMASAMGRCMKKQGVIAEWQRLAGIIAEDLSGLLTKVNERTGFSPMHYLATIADEELLTDLGIGKYDTPSSDATHSTTPAHIFAQYSPDTATAQVLSEPSPAAPKNAFGAPPRLPCWADPTAPRCEGKPDTSAFADAVHEVVKAYVPAKEWAFVAPEDLTEEDRAADDEQFIRWEERTGFNAGVFLPRLARDGPMEVTYKTLTADEFVRDYVAESTPVIAHRALPKDEAIQADQLSLFDFANMVSILESTVLPFGTRLHQSPVKYDGQASLIAFGYEQMRLGKDTSLEAPMRGPFKVLVHLPEVLGSVFTNATRETSSFTFHAGGSGSGRSMAFAAGHSIHQLVYGRRLWVFVPPAHSFTANASAVEVFEELLASKGKEGAPVFFEAQQLPGDLVYVPHGWSYLFINLRASAGWSSVFPYGAISLHDEPQSPPAQNGGQQQQQQQAQQPPGTSGSKTVKPRGPSDEL